MNMENKVIDIAKLPIMEDSRVNSIIALDDKGDVIRAAYNRNDATYTKAEIDGMIEPIESEIDELSGKVSKNEDEIRSVKGVEHTLVSGGKTETIKNGENRTLYLSTINGKSILSGENIVVEGGSDADLTGYATEQWVRQQGYVTDSDVNDYVGNEIGQVEERFADYYTKTEVDGKIGDINNILNSI